MTNEMQALAKTHTWDVVDLPPSKSAIGCQWVYKIKTRSYGSIERYKACLVTQGFSQEYGIDYEETFASVAHHTSIRSLLAIAITHKWNLCLMDVKNAFLNDDLIVDVFMKPPPGSNIQSPKIYKLCCALCGLMQASRVWFDKFNSTIQDFGFTSSYCDSALFIWKTKHGVIFPLLYVNDMIIIGNDAIEISNIRKFLNHQFEMKDLGLLNYFLGLEINCDTLVPLFLKPNMLLIFLLVLVSLIARLYLL